MRLPDVEEGLLAAAIVLGVSRDEVEGLVRTERLHQALLAPAAYVRGTPLHKSRGDIAKCLLVEVALKRCLPTREDDFKFAWMMLMRAIELSDCAWRPSRGHEARLKEFRTLLTEGIDPGRDLVRWLEEGIQGPQLRPGRVSETVPIHVSSPMHPEPEADMSAWANAVDEVLGKFLDDREGGGTPYTHRPQIYPIRADSVEELRNGVEGRIHKSDGLIVLAPQSSWGAAMDLEAGLRGLIPTLFVHPADAPPSDRARARLESMGATIYTLHTAPESKEVLDEIPGLVYSWLERSFPQILGSRRRRACLEQRLSQLRAALSAKRTALTEVEEKEALAAVGIELERARDLIEEPWGLLAASAPELVLLTTAYGLRANVDLIVEEPVPDRPPYLTPVEEVVADAFITKNNLSPRQARRLTTTAQREIAAPAVGRRRLLLTDEPKWATIYARLAEDDKREAV